MLPEGPGVVDMFCRILIAIDDDVISLDISRYAASNQRYAFCDCTCLNPKAIFKHLPWVSLALPHLFCGVLMAAAMLSS